MSNYTRVSMTPSGVMPVIYMSQYDVGRYIGFSCDGDMDDYTVTLEATRSDGVAITAHVGTDGNLCAFLCTSTMTNVAGEYLAQVVVVDSNGYRVASIPIRMVVVPAAMDENAEAIEEDASLYQQYNATVLAELARLRTCYDTVSEMLASSGLSAGDYARTLGYYAVNDGGGALYKITSSPTGYCETLNSGLYAELIHDNVINVKQFGAHANSVDDDTTAIQAALDAVPDGGVVYFPKDSGSTGLPHYRITSGLTLTKNFVTIKSDVFTEYEEGLVCDDLGITMLTIIAAGVHIDNMHFRCTDSVADYTEFTTVNAILADRSSLGDAETYGNIDITITNCSFLNINDCITVKGRNCTTRHCGFSNCKRGVVGQLYYYNDGASISDFRGFIIRDNRFHSMGNPYLQSKETLGEGNYPTSLAELDSWCVELPLETGLTSGAGVGFADISDNQCDLCPAGFYKGYMSGTTIQGNSRYSCSAMLVYSVCSSTDDMAYKISAQMRSKISGNTVNATNVNADLGSEYFNQHNIYIENMCNIDIYDNSFRVTGSSFIVLDSCPICKIENNDLVNGNFLYYADGTYNPGISANICGRLKITGNRILSQLSDPTYSYGILITNGGAKQVYMRDNWVDFAETLYSVDPASLKGSDFDGLEWQTPTMLNDYILESRSMGYRRLFNGQVEISVSLSGGADNMNAFVLPAGYRPAKDVLISGIAVYNATNEAYAYISTSGAVAVNWNSASDLTPVNIHIVFDAA